MNEIKKTQDSSFNLTPQSLDQAMQYAKLIADSDLAPKDYKGKPGNVLIAIQMGQELGLKPMQAIQNIAVINGRASIWGDAMLAVVKAHPDFKDINEYVTNGTAYCTIIRKGQEPQTRSFSLDEAKKAGLLGKPGPWTQYTNRMLQMRARGFCCRDVFPDALRGINLAEESLDIQTIEVKSNSQSITKQLGVIEKPIVDFRYEFSQCNSLEELKEKFDFLKKEYKDPKNLKEILIEKDNRKLELIQLENNKTILIEQTIVDEKDETIHSKQNEEWLADFEGKKD